jgi:Ala-tRNA(Pro) deacylase
VTVLPADHRADLQKLEKIADEPASLETEEKFELLFPNCAKGAMRPFGNLYGLPTCVDKRLTQKITSFSKRALTATPSSSAIVATRRS